MKNHSKYHQLTTLKCFCCGQEQIDYNKYNKLIDGFIVTCSLCGTQHKLFCGSWPVNQCNNFYHDSKDCLRIKIVGVDCNIP